MEAISIKLIALAVILANFFASSLQSIQLDRPLFAEIYPEAVVENLWLAYRDKIQKDGRTLDRDRNYITTSEGQSYALLRAVWIDDKEIFDRVLKWTNNNLRERDDQLFAWLWGQKDGRWGVLKEEGGINSASDADQDIALALIFAYKRWKQNHYLEQAKKILADIWEKEVVILKERPYLVAGNWAKENNSYTINPSYFMFYAYPIFNEVDPAHDWLGLKDTSYQVLQVSTLAPLDRKRSGNLPPDWISIDPDTLRVQPAIYKDKKTDFSYDAFRVLWRVTLDWEWHKDKRAIDYLKSVGTLENEWMKRGSFSDSYHHDGQPATKYENSSIYAGTYPYFSLIHPEIAKELYRKKLGRLYDSNTENFSKPLDYYSQNWVWFGFAFHAKKLPNLYLIEDEND
ncbi:MAG: Glycoside hydrolase family 8 [Parcubacteria group bacterium Gr01-1014_2]|nr:MAG: Glycoside hydrolase family 8 [Parcubacteria group bacterium Gr01-1014_2]